MSSSCSFDDLPNELWYKILEYTGPNAALFTVSKTIKKLSKDQRLWKLFCERLPKGVIIPNKDPDAYFDFYRRMHCCYKHISKAQYSFDKTAADKVQFFQASEEAICVVDDKGKLEIKDDVNDVLEYCEELSKINSIHAHTRRIHYCMFCLLVEFSKSDPNTEVIQTSLYGIKNCLVSEENYRHYFYFPEIKKLFTAESGGFVNSDYVTDSKEFKQKFRQLLHRSQLNTVPVLDKPDLKVICFAASKNYFAIHYSSGFIEIWNRAKKDTEFFLSTPLLTPPLLFETVKPRSPINSVVWTDQNCLSFLYRTAMVSIDVTNRSLESKEVIQNVHYTPRPDSFCKKLDPAYTFFAISLKASILANLKTNKKYLISYDNFIVQDVALNSSDKELYLLGLNAQQLTTPHYADILRVVSLSDFTKYQDWTFNGEANFIEWKHGYLWCGIQGKTCFRMDRTTQADQVNFKKFTILNRADPDSNDNDYWPRSAFWINQYLFCFSKSQQSLDVFNFSNTGSPK